MVTVILETDVRIKDITEVIETEYDNIAGLAIKLTELNDLSISIRDLLNQTSKLLLIDAEFERLDYVIMDKLASGEILTSDLNRLLITVQARRMDSEDQLVNLQNLNISVVLVAGNHKYIERSRVGFASKLISEFYMKFSNIKYLGVNNQLLENVEKHIGFKLDSNRILGLYGDNNRKGSHLWVFTYENSHSESLKSYIQRRKLDESYEEVVKRYAFHISYVSEIKSYSSKSYLYIDQSNLVSYLQTISSKIFN